MKFTDPKVYFTDKYSSKDAITKIKQTPNYKIDLQTCKLHQFFKWDF